MARLESVALGGYYKTPRAITKQIGDLIKLDISESIDVNIFDPCAGDGEALIDLARAVFPFKWTRFGNTPFPKLWGVELEKVRAESLKENLREAAGAASSQSSRGDAFHVEIIEDAIDLLYLNPPYDQYNGGRLEQRFLERFTPTLLPQTGVLVYVVPFYVLAEGAEFLAHEFSDITCYRFPDTDLEFKQVVLFARRRATRSMFGDKDATARILRWSESLDNIEPLRDGLPYAITLRAEETVRRFSLRIEKIDTRMVAEQFRAYTVGPDHGDIIRDLSFDSDYNELIGARYHVVAPPRPAHVAIALASGLINGRRVKPDKPDTRLPDVMVKGVFQKEYKKIDERKDKKTGEITAEVCVQQPKLSVSVLDMENWRYYDIAHGSTPTGARELAQFNIADLLTHYGIALANLMFENCPPLFDPANEDHWIELPELGLTPFRIQAQTISSNLRVLFTDREPFVGESIFVDGKVGTGKTLVSLGLAESLTPRNFEATKAKLAASGAANGKVKPVSRLLVMCPPHLIQSWTDEAAKIVPAARVTALRTLSDVNEARALGAHEEDDRPGAGLDIFILSREMAKLGHPWDIALTTQDTCPTCGKAHKRSKSLVSQRATCDGVEMAPQDSIARMARSLAVNLVGVFPKNEMIEALTADMRTVSILRARSSDDEADTLAAWRKTQRVDIDYKDTMTGKIARTLYDRALAQIAADDWSGAGYTIGIIQSALMAQTHPQRDAFISIMVKGLFGATAHDAGAYSNGASTRDLAWVLALLMGEVGGATQTALYEWLMARPEKFDKDSLRKSFSALTGAPNPFPHRGFVRTFSLVDGLPTIGRAYDGFGVIKLGESRAALNLLEKLATIAKFAKGKCDTPLFQASSELRRYPLATYICKRHPDMFDMLVLDEAHEYNNDGSAQERAAHRLTELGKTTVVLTGTSNNGYASSLFMNMWALSRKFRKEYGRDEIQKFVTRYGYRKVLVEKEDKKGKFIATRGSVSDRADTDTSIRMRNIGQAPGVLPLFILKHFLTIAVMMQKSDLDDELPPLVETKMPLDVDNADLLGEYKRLESTLVAQIMDDLQDEDLAGKLWGQLCHLPTMLDRATDDTGNAVTASGKHRYEVRYPDSVGAELVAASNPLPAAEITQKESWMLDAIEAEWAEGRPTMVFIWNTQGDLPARLLRIIDDRLGAGSAVHLNASKVSAAKRQGWITKNVVKKKKKVLIVNPKAVETGLNNLTYFPTAIWLQVPPSCSSVIYDQANGRIHRPGQLSDKVRVYVPYYEGTAQEGMFSLLGAKVIASRQVDGVDISSALITAGADDQSVLDTLAIGRALYQMIVSRDGYAQTKFGANGNGHNGHANGNGNGYHKRTPASVKPAPPTMPIKRVESAAGTQMRLF